MRPPFLEALFRTSHSEVAPPTSNTHSPKMPLRKYLGVNIDRNLSFNKHAKYLKQK